jgi:hypothetical protein
MWTGWPQVGRRILGRPPNQRLRMRDPECEGLGNRLFIGETALGPLSLKLPVQIGGQPHGCFDRRTGAHTTRSPNFGIVLQKAIARHRVNRVHPAGQPTSLRGHFCSSIRTNWNASCLFFIRRRGRLQGLCSEFRTQHRPSFGHNGLVGCACRLTTVARPSPADHVPPAGVSRRRSRRSPVMKAV